MKNSNLRTELWRSVKFTLFSISAGVVQIGSFTLLMELLHWPEWVSHLISLVLSVLWNFTLNRKYTFQSATNVPIAMLKVAAFYLVFTPLSTWWTAALTEPSYGIMRNGYVVEIGTMLLNFVLEFLYQRFFVFAKSIDTAKAKKEEAEA